MSGDDADQLVELSESHAAAGKRDHLRVDRSLRTEKPHGSVEKAEQGSGSGDDIGDKC